MLRNAEFKRDLAAFSKEIRMSMAREDLNQSDLARGLRVSPQVISYWLNHPESLTVRKLAELNAMLHMDPEAFNRAAHFEEA